jgi:hypothetical protein
MARNTKTTKATKKSRTKVKNLQVGEKELRTKDKKKIKGGLLPAVRNLSSNTIGATVGSDTFTSSIGGDSINFKK